MKAGFLKEVIKGRYIPSRPAEAPGDSTAWCASFRDFRGAYLTGRFGREWCVPPEQSLSIHAGNGTAPAQLEQNGAGGGVRGQLALRRISAALCNKRG